MLDRPWVKRLRSQSDAVRLVLVVGLFAGVLYLPMLGAVGLCRSSRAGGGVGGFFVGLGLGLLGGAAASLLLTPYSGSEAREKLLRASEDIGRTVSNKVGELARARETSTPAIASSSTVGASYGTRSL